MVGLHCLQPQPKLKLRTVITVPRTSIRAWTFTGSVIPYPGNPQSLYVCGDCGTYTCDCHSEVTTLRCYQHHWNQPQCYWILNEWREVERLLATGNIHDHLATIIEAEDFIQYNYLEDRLEAVLCGESGRTGRAEILPIKDPELKTLYLAAAGLL